MKNYTFSEESTGIVETANEGKLRMENGRIIFNGLRAGSLVSAYLQDGRLVRNCKADRNGMAVVDLSGLPKGVVILHSNNTDIKIINK